MLENVTRGVLDLESLQLNYVETGSGEAVLCLHGEAPGASGELDFAENAGQLSQQFRTLLLDLPSGLRGDAGAELILKALDALSLPKVHVIGNGTGGEIALRLAVLAPQRVGKIVVIGPSGCLFSPFTPPPLEGKKAIDAYWRDPGPETLKEALRLYVYDNSLNSDEVLERRQEHAREHPLLTQEATETDLLSIAASVGASTLLVWGREDRLSPIDFGLNLLARIPDAQFHMLGQCGHWGQRERPLEFNQLVSEFLAFDGQKATEEQKKPGVLTSENTTKFADAGGVKIHYHEAGEGPALIMVPGTGAGASAWGQNRYNIEGLSRHFRVILYNPPPVGQSDKTLESDAPRNAFYAKMLTDFMDELGIEKAHFCGGSPGAAQVIWLALNQPDRVDKLVLQCVPGIGPSYFTPFPWEGARLTGVAGRDPSYENVLAQIGSMIPRPDRQTEDIIMDRYNAANDEETNEARKRITGPQENLTSELGKIGHSTLIIWGLNERDVPLDFGLKLAVSLAKSRFHIYGDRTGHFPQFERAEEFNSLVSGFLLD